MPKIINPIVGRNYVIITPDSTYEKISDIDTLFVESLYKKFGAILFRGYDFNIDIFRRLTKTYCSHSMKN